MLAESKKTYSSGRMLRPDFYGRGLVQVEADVLVTHARRYADGSWEIAVSCPFCRNSRAPKPVVHWHGAGTGDIPSIFGPRLSHCKTGRRMYNLLPAARLRVVPAPKLPSVRYSDVDVTD